MSKERELLERALPWISKQDPLSWNIKDFLSTPEPTQDEEPVAWMFFSKVGSLHYHTSEQQALKGLRMHGGKKVIALYERPAPRPEFVRLSEEEVDSLTYAPYEPYELICAVENRLVEKNK